MSSTSPSSVAQSFTTTLIRSLSTPTTTSLSITATKYSTSTSLSPPTSAPEAPLAISPGRSNIRGWSPASVIGIVAAVIFILLCIPLIALLLRRYERKRCREVSKPSAGWGGKEEGESMRSIMVTREMQRVSLRLSKLEQVHLQGRGWTRAEVRGGKER